MKIFGIFVAIIIALFMLPVGAVYATRASLLCTPGSGTYNVGDTITVNYVLDTRSFPADGADIVATYTPSVLEVVGTQSTPSITDTHWTAPVTNTVDSSLGKIRLDYGKAQTAFTGNSPIGQITFKAKAAGQAQFNFIFFQQYDDTTIDGGAAKVWGKKTEGAAITNILTDVTNCVYVISQIAPTATPAPGVTVPPAVTVPPITQLPRTGSTEVTISLLILAAIFVSGGVILPLFITSRE